MVIQACAAVATNIHIPNFFKGVIYRGDFKKVCVPGLNCYSCPGAAGACPIGAYQAVAGSSKFSVSMYIFGFLVLVGMLLGRFVCGFLCPFGWFQELINKIPFKKFSTKKLRVLTYIKYIILAIMVFTLPAVVTNEVGMGNPFFCKYICPVTVFLKPTSYFSLLRVKCDEEKCVSCGKCRKVCPMNVNPSANSRKRENATECILCLRCVEECPKKALKL